MRGCIGWLILLPFAGAWWLTIKIVDACIKKNDALRPLGIIISLLVGGGSIYAGYSIGPIVGWFIMGVGGLVTIVGVWRSLVVTKEQIELEELTEKLEKEREEEERTWAKEQAKRMLEQDEIDDYEIFNRICYILDKTKITVDSEAFDLSWKLKELKKKQAKRQKGDKQ